MQEKVCIVQKWLLQLEKGEGVLPWQNELSMNKTFLCFSAGKRGGSFAMTKWTSHQQNCPIFCCCRTLAYLHVLPKVVVQSLKSHLQLKVFVAAVKLSYLCSCRKLSLRTARLQRQTQAVNMHFSVINYCSYNCGSDSLLLWSGLVAALGALAALWYPTASRLFAVA